MATSTAEQQKKSGPTRVFIVCSGLGRITRGFESFMQECFETLKEEPDLDVTLYKGGGHSAPREYPNLELAARRKARRVGWARTEARMAT